MNKQQIIEEVRKAASADSPLQITGYTSASGEVLDYEVRLLPADGYHNLISRSLAFLKSGGVEKPEHVNQADWDAAAAEQAASWQRTLDGNQKERSDKLQAEAGFWLNPEQPDVVVLRHLSYRSKVVVSPSAKTSNSSSKTIAKKALVDQTPIASYVGQLNLAPGKFTTVSAL